MILRVEITVLPAMMSTGKCSAMNNLRIQLPRCDRREMSGYSERRIGSSRTVTERLSWATSDIP